MCEVENTSVPCRYVSHLDRYITPRYSGYCVIKVGQQPDTRKIGLYGTTDLVFCYNKKVVAIAKIMAIAVISAILIGKSMSGWQG